MIISASAINSSDHLQ